MHTIWVMNGKGGVGKSVLTMALAWLYEASWRPLRMIDIDDKAKLAEFAGKDKVLSLRIGASAEELRADPALAYSYWDQLAAEILENDTIIDTGANIDRPLLEWARKSELAELLSESSVTMDLYVPITADPLSVRGGLDVLETVGEIFPECRRILVLNRIAGQFNAYESTPEFQCVADLRSQGLIVLPMAACLSEAWTDFERLKLPPWKVLTMNAAEVARQTGLGILAAKRAAGDYASWIKQLQQTFGPLVAKKD